MVALDEVDDTIQRRAQALAHPTPKCSAASGRAPALTVPCAPTPLDVLHWVMDSTAAATADQLPLWTLHGLDFARDVASGGPKTTAEVISVAEMYGPALRFQSVAQLCDSVIAARWTRSDSDAGVARLGGGVDAIVDRVRGSARRYGSSIEVLDATVHNECEREMQQEREVQRETQRQVCAPSPSRSH